MIGKIKATLLTLLCIPAEPEPPAGAPESVRVFRAAPNYYRLKLLKWGAGQVVAFIGMIAALPALWSADLGGATVPFRLVESTALVLFFLQLPFTWLLIRFDYEMRWYIVTDRSLRIRYGIQHVREMTMTFANIQQITIRQGPLQRALGIADLQVRTAGGGSGESSGQGGHHSSGNDSMHLGFFRGVENATDIRDLMLDRLRHWQDAGLGDPDDLPQSFANAAHGGQETGVSDAAQRVLAEARALRNTVERSFASPSFERLESGAATASPGIPSAN